MRKLKLKPFVIPTLSFIALFGLLISAIFMQTSGSLTAPGNYVTDIILGNKLPVINETDVIIINPYVSDKVTIGKSYYDEKASEEEQEKSIVKYDDTYMQNSGIDFVSDDDFDIVAILDGEVISISDDETLGNVVKIQHENGYVSIYQSMKEVQVKKGDMVVQGQIIGKSDTNKLDKDLGNHLHFELYINGQMVNPINYLNKSIKTKGE